MVSTSKQSECFDFWAVPGGQSESLMPVERALRASPDDGLRHHGLNLALIDPRPLTRSSISQWLSNGAPGNGHSAEFAVRASSSLDEFLSAQRYDREDWAVILLNLGPVCAGEDKAQEDIGRLREEFPATPLILMADCENPRHIVDVLRTGVRGYVPTAHDPAMLVHGIGLVLAGGVYIPPSILAVPEPESEAPKPDGNGAEAVVPGEFTPRQAQVFRLLRQGKSNKVIAYELGMQESTVKVHVRQIMRKLKATNRTHAAFLASRMADERVGSSVCS